MRVLFADSLDESPLAPLRSRVEVVVQPELTAETLADAIGGFDILVVRSTKVGAEVIAKGDRLGLIVRAGAGTDTIDRAAASAAGIYVTNVPGRNAAAVAELTMGLLLAIDRKLVDNTVDLRAGEWNKSHYSRADGILGKRLAVLGLGEIGLAVAGRARAFGMSVSGLAKPGRSSATRARINRLGITLVDDLGDLLSRADVLTVHVPGVPGTTGLIDAKLLAMLPDRAIVLNTARGEVIDEAALIEAMDQRGLRAGIDVWADEPGSSTGSFRSALAAHPNVVGTHHIGASTAQSQTSIAEGTVEVIEAYLDGMVVNCVNMVSEPQGAIWLGIRHLDRVGVLAKIFDVLRSDGLSVKQMQNQPFEGGHAAVATINVEGEPGDEVLAHLREINEVLSVSITRRR